MWRVGVLSLPDSVLNALQGSLEGFCEFDDWSACSASSMREKPDLVLIGSSVLHSKEHPGLPNMRENGAHWIILVTEPGDPLPHDSSELDLIGDVDAVVELLQDEDLSSARRREENLPHSTCLDRPALRRAAWSLAPLSINSRTAEVMEALCDAALALTGWKSVRGFVSQGSPDWHIWSCEGLNPTNPTGPWAWPAITGRGRPRPAILRRHTSDSVLAQPIVWAGRCRAVLELTDGRDGNGCSEEAALDSLYAIAALGAPELARASVIEQSKSDELDSPIANAIYTRQWLGEVHQTSGELGPVLGIKPSWLRSVYAALALCGVLCLLGLYVGPGTPTSRGPAVIRSSDSITLRAKHCGLVESVVVAAGEIVEPGTPLLRLGPAPRQCGPMSMLQLGMEPQAATCGEQEEIVEPREILADRSGVVEYVGVSPGTLIREGDAVIVLQSDSRFEVVALLPGRDLPRLSMQTRMLIAIDGVESDPIEVNVTSIGRAAIPPHLATRAWGVHATDASIPADPAVVVHGQLSRNEYKKHGRSYPLVDGLHAEALVRLSFPGPSQFLSGAHYDE